MNFTQIEFLIFLAVVVVVTWSARRVELRNGWLLLASYYFYAYWDIRFCALLVLSTSVDFFAARRIDASADASHRRLWLTVSVCTNLGVLGLFKYFHFFIDTARPILEQLGVATAGVHQDVWTIVLPVGISFFTFQTLSYTADVYRRKIPASDKPLDFALYVAFFPQLVAGPIVRAANLLPQLSELPPFSRRRFYGGFQQLLRGAVKKVLIADRLAETVDVVFAGPELYSTATVWLAVVAYTGQIYYDFSGYTDMAIGVAKLLGYRFPVNFRHPYLATSIQQFWRRWHITLSTWLRDYLYIPLGGSRGSRPRVAANLMITMTLGGLWHGAAMTFVLWGVWHGAALVIQRTTSGWLAPRSGTSFWRAVGRHPAVGWCLTIAVVMAGWVLFRSPSLETAGEVFAGLTGLRSSGIRWWPPLTLIALALMLAEHLGWRTRLRRAMRLPIDAWYSPVVTTFAVWALLLYAPRGFRPFVYFQF